MLVEFQPCARPIGELERRGDQHYVRNRKQDPDFPMMSPEHSNSEYRKRKQVVSSHALHNPLLRLPRLLRSSPEANYSGHTQRSGTFVLLRVR